MENMIVEGQIKLIILSAGDNYNLWIPLTIYVVPNPDLFLKSLSYLLDYKFLVCLVHLYNIPLAVYLKIQSHASTLRFSGVNLLSQVGYLAGTIYWHNVLSNYVYNFKSLKCSYVIHILEINLNSIETVFRDSYLILWKAKLRRNTGNNLSLTPKIHFYNNKHLRILTCHKMCIYVILYTCKVMSHSH